MCSVEGTPTYNPNFFDDFCANFYWCLRIFDTSSCDPYLAYGLTKQQYKIFESIAAAIPAFFAFLTVGYVSTCMYVYDSNVTTCSFGVFASDDGRDVIWSDVDPYAPSALEFDANIGTTEIYSG